jgi:Subtilase family/FG-GAP-like repeat
MRRRFGIGLAALAGTLAITVPAFAAMPYARPGADTTKYTDLYLNPGETPNDLDGDGNTFKFAATSDPSNGPQINSNPFEMFGVRGAHIDDADPSVNTAWMTTTGRPDVSIAVLDSGIKWNDPGAMSDLRLKVRLNPGELPIPRHDLSTAISDPGQNDCSTFTAQHDANGDGVFNIDDYACDSRVAHVLQTDPRRAGPSGVLTPEDLVIAFSDGTDSDHNGFVDDIAGWDFLDNDNDPFDDVQYGHGTGEAHDSSSEADNGDQAGACPNCMVLPLRVGDSFVADVNNFAQATLYATDNGIDVVQEALGSLNNSTLAREAVDYAYRHDVTVIASAADEAAQHNNWPSSLPHVILVNSVTTGAAPTPDQSYLSFNGCTNFNAKVTLAIPSTSCSSNATGLAAGMAGLVYSAALDARAKGALSNYPESAGCQRTDGSPCVITPNEVRQVMASGAIGGVPQADDVNFASAAGDPEPSCSPAPAPGCTDPGGPGGALQDEVNANRQAPIGPPGLFESYPARRGFDQFYGYGKVNMANALDAVLSDPSAPAPSQIPPEAEITSPQWYQQVDPSNATVSVTGDVYARGSSYTCEVLVAPGEYPNNDRTTASPPGDFEPLNNGWCDGATSHTSYRAGPLGTITTSELMNRFPPGTDFHGPEPQASPTNDNGRPNAAPHAFTVEVVVHSTHGGHDMAGSDRRAAYLEHDKSMLTGFPKAITSGAITTGTPTGDGESSPVLADLNGDNRNELIVAGSDGFVHAIERDGSELPGWPVRVAPPPLHTGEQAFASGAVSTNVGAAILGSVAVTDTNRDGVPEVFADDMAGRVYGWDAKGHRFFLAHSNPAYSGKPLQPFVEPRYQPGQSKFHRTQQGFISSPVLADLNGDGKMEVIAAGMDRHLYAWHRNGSSVAGFPVLVVDPSKAQSVDPQTDQVTFKSDSGSYQQGAIVDTPAVGDLNGDGKPEIVLGTNEEYAAANDGGWNAAPANSSSFNLLDQIGQGVDAFKAECGAEGGGAICNNIPDVPLKPANTRLYAIQADGDNHAGGPFLPGWPAKPAIVDAELLPVVGEGMTGYPVIGNVSCGSGGGPKVGAMSNNGLAYVFNPNGQSCYGRTGGADIPLQTDGYGSQPDHPLVPAVGSPAFANLDGTGLSFVAPAAGLGRALDVAFPDYQPTGQDFLAAWSVTGAGQLRPNFPQPVNDLQFLTGPSVADLDGRSGQEIVEGTASMDLNAFSDTGAELRGWPKLTGDWTITNPTIGSFGTQDTDSSAHKIVIGETRSGYINAYRTAAPACSPSAWPRFHHDNANSGDYGRDAILPGTPYDAQLHGTTLTFKAPGDDLLCGTAAHYRVVTSNTPIQPTDFGKAKWIGGAGAPKEAGSNVTFSIPARAKRFVAIRAVDDQGNVGRPLVIDLGPRRSASASGLRPSSSRAARRSSRTRAGSGSPDRAPASCSSPSPRPTPSAASQPPADTSQASRRSPGTGTCDRRSRAPAAP